MNENEIVFKSEDSMWQMLASGEKTWDARRWDMTDERIVRLCKGHWAVMTKHSRLLGRMRYYEFDEPHVCFLNKVTGEIIKIRFEGLNFIEWAPGWCFLKLGGIVERTGPC